MCFLSAFLRWQPRRWAAAVLAAGLSFVVLGVSTAVIPNPVFGRSIAPTEWAMEVLVVTSVLSGLLFASYVRNDTPVRGRTSGGGSLERADSGSRFGAAGGLLAYLAIGCPVCNKVVLIALGSSGAVTFFAPVQPYLGALGMFLLGFALLFRLNREAACHIPGGVAGESAEPATAVLPSHPMTLDQLKGSSLER